MKLGVGNSQRVRSKETWAAGYLREVGGGGHCEDVLRVTVPHLLVWFTRGIPPEGDVNQRVHKVWVCCVAGKIRLSAGHTTW